MSDALIQEKEGISAMLRSPLTWAILVALGLGAFLYYPLFFSTSPQALSLQSEEFFFEANEAAGAPVLMLSLWLFYRRSHYLDFLRGPGQPVVAGLVFAATATLFSWGVYTDARDLQLASIIGLLAGVVLLLGGGRALRVYWLPILFLGFALPISPVLLSAAMYPVQLATAQYAGAILNAIGVASFVQGDQILRPENTFVVIETCSGLRTVVTLTMLTVLLIDLFERRGWHAALLIVLAPIVAFLTNGIRVVTLVLNPHSDIASIHNLQGIGMLLVGLTAMYLIDALIARILKSDEAQALQDARAETEIVNRGDSSRWVALRVLIVCGVLIGLLGLGELIPPWSFARDVDEMPSEVLARAFGEWPSREIEDDYQFRGSVRYLSWARRRVEVAGGSVEVFLGVAEEQRREHTILTPRLAWPGSGYAAVEDAWLPIRALGEDVSGSESDGGGDRVRRVVLRRGAKSVLSYSWYEREKSLPVEWLRQAAAIDRSPLARPEHMLALRISTYLGVGGTRVDEAEERIRRVYRRLAPELRGFAPTRIEREDASTDRPSI